MAIGDHDLSGATRLLTLSAPIAYQSDLDAICKWAKKEFTVDEVEITSVLQMTGIVRPDGHIAVLGSQTL
jgi:hypothetical protein